MEPMRQLAINNKPFTGKSVVYVMHRDQRTHDNHALVAAQSLAIQHDVPLYVLFVLRTIKPRAREHYQFMLSGLTEVASSLAKLSIPFTVRIETPEQSILSFAQEVSAGALFFDFSPLQPLRSLIKNVAILFEGPVTVVDTHNIIPTWILSDKKEYAAHTIRTKVHKKLEAYLLPAQPLVAQHPVSKIPKTASNAEITEFLKTIPSSGIVIAYPAGQSAAMRQLNDFIENSLGTYATDRNNIEHDAQTGLSPYLHFGQISSLRVALEVISHSNQPPILFEQARLAQAGDTPSVYDGMNALLEEIIVRKELADNFCFYSDSYSTLSAAPKWAIESLEQHTTDPRDFLYTQKQWELAATHDPAWNAAQTELLKTGKIHGYMRMYWAKKILEWSATPSEAIQTAIYLNDKYSVDGSDPNGYVGILWSIAGLHDRPWFERSVYGKVRYMNRGGLERKFNVGAYINRIGVLHDT